MDNENRVYLGVSETSFKGRYSSHVKDGKHERYSNATELWKYVWDLEPNDKVPIITGKLQEEFMEIPNIIFADCV